jgi:hypothetical protein
MLAGYDCKGVTHGTKGTLVRDLVAVVQQCDPKQQLPQQHQSHIRPRNPDFSLCSWREGRGGSEAGERAPLSEEIVEGYLVSGRVRVPADTLVGVYLVLEWGMLRAY